MNTENEGLDTPVVSVIIPSVNGLPIVAECLEALLGQEGAERAEVLVVDRCGEATRAILRERFPGVRLLAAEGTTSIPELRVRGLEQARGQVAALLEDHCLVRPGWLQAVLRAHQAGHRAVGGAILNGGREHPVDWAVFLCEYASFLPPPPRGVVPAIPGNNSAFDRGVLEQLGPAAASLGLWEAFWHERLRRLGVLFHSDPDMTVLHKKSFGLTEALGQRYHYSRSYAAMRLRSAPWWQRLAYAGATVLLPALLLGRISSAAWRKGCGRPWLQALPVIALLVVVWAVGEGVGALWGPGRSLQWVQ